MSRRLGLLPGVVLITAGSIGRSVQMLDLRTLGPHSEAEGMSARGQQLGFLELCV